MGGLTLALAPACIALAGWVTWLHLRPDAERPLYPSPLAWLSTVDQGREGGARLSVRSPWLWLTRLTLIVLFMCLPVSYQPWVHLLLERAPRGTLVLTTGPITINPSWERPLWFMTPSLSAHHYQWLDGEGDTHTDPVKLDATPSELFAPRVRHPEPEDAEVERLVNHASGVLRARGHPVRSAVIAQASSPALLGARLSWRTQDSARGPSLGLHLEAHVHRPPYHKQPVALSVEVKRPGSWEPLKALRSMRSDQREHGLWEVWLEPIDAERPLRVCLDHPPQLRECLSLTRPPQPLKVAKAGWPEGAKLILEALTDVEWVDERNADWVSRVGRATELPHALQSLSPTSSPSRLFLFLEGSEPEASVWGEDLTLGTLEQIKRWGPLPKLSTKQLSDLAPWASSSHARSLAHAPYVNPRGLKSLTPVLRELTLSSTQRALKVVLAGWHPQAQDELTTLSAKLDEWATLHRSRVVTHTRGPLPLSLTRAQRHEELAKLLTRPHNRQRTSSVPLDARSQPKSDPPAHDTPPLTLWGILTLTALLSVTRRSSLSVVATSLSLMWALSASPEGSSLRGLGGLWVGSPRVFVTLDERAEVDRVSARALWRAWRQVLQRRGVSLRGRQTSRVTHLHVGHSPPRTASQARWVIPTPTARAQLSLGALSSAWASDQRTLWVSATLMADASIQPDPHRYELWLKSASAPLFMGACQGSDCDDLRLTTSLYDPRGALSVALYQAPASPSLSAQPDRPDSALIDERALLAPERPTQPVAWTWGQQSAPWLSAAGYLRRPASSLRHLPPEDVQLISLHDIPAERITSEEVVTLERWVSAGGTLLLSGRSHSFDQGGWLGTRLEGLSPFRSRPTSTEQARVLFFIDVSGSVAREAGGPGVSALIEDSLRLATQLGARDEVGLITFAGDAELVIPPTRIKELSAVMATKTGAGGSVLKVALDEALRWVGERGPQRWVLLTDGELSGAGLNEALSRVQATRVQRDLSLLVALTSERPLSAEATQTITALEERLDARVTPLSQLTPATFVSWVDQRALGSRRAEPPVGSSNKLGSSNKQEQVWGTAWAQARLGVKLPPVRGGAGVQLKLGATLLAERQSAEGRRPLLAEWRYGLGRVVALATDQWGLSARGWSALLPSPKQVSRGGRRFTWRSARPSLVSSGPVGDILSARGVILGPQGEVISGRWRPLLGGGATLLAQDGGLLDERGRPFGSIRLRSQTSTGLLKTSLSSAQEGRALNLTPKGSKSLSHARWLSEREAKAPSPALIDELVQLASPPAPLPSVALVILLIGLSWAEARQWWAERAERVHGV